MTCADVDAGEPTWLQDAARHLRRAVREHRKLFPETEMKLACGRSPDGQFLEASLNETWNGGGMVYHLSVHAWSRHLLDMAVNFADLASSHKSIKLPVARAKQLYNLHRYCSGRRAHLVLSPVQRPHPHIRVLGIEINITLQGLNGELLRDFLEEGRTVASETLALLLRGEGPDYWMKDANAGDRTVG